LSAISWRDQVIFRSDDDASVFFVIDQHVKLDFLSAIENGQMYSHDSNFPFIFHIKLKFVQNIILKSIYV